MISLDGSIGLMVWLSGSFPIYRTVFLEMLKEAEYFFVEVYELITKRKKKIF